jgi:hypothetical protein
VSITSLRSELPLLLEQAMALQEPCWWIAFRRAIQDVLEEEDGHQHMASSSIS